MAFTPWDKMRSLKNLAEIEKKSCPRPEPWLVPSSVEKHEWWVATSKAIEKEQQISRNKNMAPGDQVSEYLEVRWVMRMSAIANR